MRVKWKWLSGSGLKLLAVVSMLVDHLAAFVWKGDPLVMSHLFKIGHRWVTPYILMRSFGRLAFPLFAFLIVEGFVHTRSRKRYGLNLGVFALISEIPFNLIHSSSLFFIRQNVFFTLFFGFLGLCAIEYFKEDKKKMAISLLGLLAVSFFFRADYGYVGYGLILMLYVLRENLLFKTIFGCCMLSRQWIAGAAFIPISMYNGKRGFIQGTFAKYCFYAFYPVHLLVLYLIKTL
ncbi:MAG: conjugal transfer protein TraX [Bacteroidales bacterium]|nr:conjugal transfer protein TraX [Bacteroidales bacterium]